MKVGICLPSAGFSLSIHKGCLYLLLSGGPAQSSAKMLILRHLRPDDL